MRIRLSLGSFSKRLSLGLTKGGERENCQKKKRGERERNILDKNKGPINRYSQNIC